MPRPKRCCRVEGEPAASYFKPRGIPMTALEETTLGLEELEAIRLKDLESLDQQDAAARMDISRPTFQRVLAAARAKIADALVNGKALRLEGGNYQLASPGGRGHHGHGCACHTDPKEVAG